MNAFYLLLTDIYVVIADASGGLASLEREALKPKLRLGSSSLQ